MKLKNQISIFTTSLLLALSPARFSSAQTGFSWCTAVFRTAAGTYKPVEFFKPQDSAIVWRDVKVWVRAPSRMQLSFNVPLPYRIDSEGLWKPLFPLHPSPSGGLDVLKLNSGPRIAVNAGRDFLAAFHEGILYIWNLNEGGLPKVVDYQSRVWRAHKLTIRANDEISISGVGHRQPGSPVVMRTFTIIHPLHSSDSEVSSSAPHPSSPFADWNLTTRAQNALKNLGIRGTEDLLRYTMEEFENLPGIGERMVLDIEDELHRRGLEFRPPQNLVSFSIINPNLVLTEFQISALPLPMAIHRNLRQNKITTAADLLRFYRPQEGRFSRRLKLSEFATSKIIEALEEAQILIPPEN